MNRAWTSIWGARPQAQPHRASADGSRLGALDDALIQDGSVVRQHLQSLIGRRASVVLQGSDGAPGAVARLVSGGNNGLLLALQGDALGDALPAQMNAAASAERGLLLFTLRDTCRWPGGLLHAAWPDNLLRIQSRRCFRVCPRLDQAWLSWPHQAQRWAVHDISEEGIGLWLPPDQSLPIDQGKPALLQLDGLRLTVPALAAAHGAPERTGLARRRVGLQLVGMSGPDTRALRCWLMAQQAVSLVRRPDQV